MKEFIFGLVTGAALIIALEFIYFSLVMCSRADEELEEMILKKNNKEVK